MKRRYDFDELSSETGFNPVQIEKVCRISDVLEEVSSVPFMRKRLALYGGTALAFIHFDAIERLSVDLDFNYRHLDGEDWGIIRDQIDGNMKTILYRLGYSDDDITINPTYPLNRFTLKYVNHRGRPDDIMIETGYMRRIPILEKDEEYDFYHIGTHNRFNVKTPMREELFSNKWCTMLYRRSPRDLFDVYRILRENFDMELFRVAAVFDSLMRGKPRLTDIQLETVIHAIKFDTSLLNVLYTDTEFEESEVHEEVVSFSKKTIEQLSDDELLLIERFYNEYLLDDKIIENLDGVHENINKHPLLQWQIKQLSRTPSLSHE